MATPNISVKKNNATKRSENKGNKTMSMKDLVGKAIQKKVPFMGDEVEIRKLSVAEVLEIQKGVKEMQADADDADSTQGIDVLIKLIKVSVTGADELSDEDYNSFPMEELSGLSDSILEFSGMTSKVQIEAGKPVL